MDDAELQRECMEHRSKPGLLCWSVTAILLSFLCLTHLGAMLCFMVGSGISPFVAPVALVLSLAAGDWLAQREGLRGRLRTVPLATALAVVAVAHILAASFFDFGWDGLWYHQTAVYQMAHGWNPLQDPMHSFRPDLEPMLRHYSKEPWYVALALFETTRNIESAKAGTWMALAAMFFAVCAASLDCGMRRRTAVVIAALVSLNPVVVCESASYLVDGLMVSFLACFVAALFRWFQQPELQIPERLPGADAALQAHPGRCGSQSRAPERRSVTCSALAARSIWKSNSSITLVVVLASAILCINTKLNGLVYLCFVCAAGGLYALIKRRDLLVRYAVVQIAAVVLGVVIFGFNPYVTNTVYRGNPFYPLLGTAANPGMGQGTQNPIDRYETPRNMVGRSPVVRLGYSVFSRPGAQPVFGGENAQLMWPFDVGWKDFNMFRIHGVRISGFGPLFSGAFLISLVLLGVALVRPGVPRGVVLLFTGTIIVSLLVSTHTWWARLGPQLWWLPIIAVIAGLRRSDSLDRGSAPASGAVVGALAHHMARRNQEQLSIPASAPDPTGGGAGRDTRGRVCSPVSTESSRPGWPGCCVIRWTAWGLAMLLLLNATLVAFAHFRWEIDATRTAHEQMAMLRQKGEVEVDFQYFREPFGERLRAAGVTFRAVRRLECDNPMELMSVAPGYPGAVRVCVHGEPSRF